MARLLKKAFVLVLIAVCIAALTAGFAFAAPKSGEKYKIAVSLPTTDNAWMGKLLELLEEECKNETDKFEYTVKSAVDTADQQNTLETFRQGGFDLIIILPGDATLVEQICEKIYDEGTPTVILDRTLDSQKYTAYVGGDNTASAAAAADYIGKVLEGKGRVAVLRNWVGRPNDLMRYNGFADELKAKFPGIEIVREVEGENSPEKGYEAMSNILTAVPQLDAVYAQVDESGIGALTAIQNAKRVDVKYIVGIGGARECFDLIKKDTTYTAVTTYFPTLGSESIKIARKILKGEPYDKDFIDPCYTVTKENVDQYYKLGF